MCSKVAVMKSSKFEVARESLETVPSRSPGVGASPLGRDGPAPPLRRAAGALGQLCRQTCSGKFWRRSGTGGTPGRIRTDHIVQIHGGEPPRAHRRDGSRGTGPRRQRGESCSRRPADMAVRTAGSRVVRCFHGAQHAPRLSCGAKLCLPPSSTPPRLPQTAQDELLRCQSARDMTG